LIPSKIDPIKELSDSAESVVFPMISPSIAWMDGGGPPETRSDLSKGEVHANQVVDDPSMWDFPWYR
jgi:hypothetical protein